MEIKMKAINLIKNNIFTLLNSGCSNNEIYEAIEEIETLQQSLKSVMLSYDECYSQLRGMDMLLQSKQDDWIEEIETLQQELKQGQDNYDKLWDMYSELKQEKEKINDTRS